MVDAAVRAVREHGPSVGMEEVAAAARTSKAGLYRYFADRDALHLAVCTRVSERLVAQLGGALADAVGPREQLTAAVDVYLRVIESDPQVYRFVVSRPAGAAGSDPVGDLSALVGAHVATVIADRLSGVGADTAAAGPWGHGIVGLVRSAADHWLDQRPQMSREALRDHLVDLGWSGLAGILAAATGRPVDSSPPTWRPS